MSESFEVERSPDQPPKREAMQILGGAGYLKANSGPGKVERIYREVRVNAIGGGSEEIMLDLASRQLGF